MVVSLEETQKYTMDRRTFIKTSGSVILSAVGLGGLIATLAERKPTSYVAEEPEKHNKLYNNVSKVNNNQSDNGTEAADKPPLPTKANLEYTLLDSRTLVPYEERSLFESELKVYAQMEKNDLMNIYKVVGDVNIAADEDYVVLYQVLNSERALLHFVRKKDERLIKRLGNDVKLLDEIKKNVIVTDSVEQMYRDIVQNAYIAKPESGGSAKFVPGIMVTARQDIEVQLQRGAYGQYVAGISTERDVGRMFRDSGKVSSNSGTGSDDSGSSNPKDDDGKNEYGGGRDNNGGREGR